MDKDKQQERRLTAQQLLTQGFKEHQEQQKQLNRQYLEKRGYTDDQITAQGSSLTVDELAKQEREKEQAEAYMKEAKKHSAKAIEKSKRLY